MYKKILIAYYSYSGNTKKIAHMINEQVQAMMYEIEPKQNYSKNYDDVVQQAKKEISIGFKPVLKSTKVDISDYDVLFIGSPNWWYTIAPPVSTFLHSINLDGKTVIPFITHGGGGLAKSIDDIKELCPKANVLAAIELYQSGSEASKKSIAVWLEKSKIL